MQINKRFFVNSIKLCSAVKEFNGLNKFFCHFSFNHQLLSLLLLVSFSLIFASIFLKFIKISFIIEQTKLTVKLRIIFFYINKFIIGII